MSITLPRHVEILRMRRIAALSVLVVSCILAQGCATIRTTDPPRTATELYLLSEATRKAIDQITADAMRDRKVFVDASYLTANVSENLFAIAELRRKLLMDGVRLMEKREQAEVIVEVRSGGIGIDRLEYLLGIPSLYLTGGRDAAQVPIATPELSIVKNIRQKGYASVAFVAYWADTGELVASSGPFLGKTFREDWWIFGVGPKTLGNIPPAQK
jgi:hypothetical protein